METDTKRRKALHFFIRTIEHSTGSFLLKILEQLKNNSIPADRAGSRPSEGPHRKEVRGPS